MVFHLGLIFSGLTPNLVARPLHMALALPWVFLYVDVGGWRRWWGVFFVVIGLSGTVYIALNEAQLGDQYGYLSGPGQLYLAISLLLVTLEMARRAVGWPLPLVALCALLYGAFGQYVPGEIGHAGMPLESLLGTLVIAEGGLWGKLTGVSVSIVSIFVIMGAVLNAGEAGQGFMNLASAVAGRLRGGAAKVSTLSSALFGSVSGSASANVASTGAMTLPAMTKLGYPKALAAAVEAVASSGGQIMPPLMGAGAFVMVELTGIPYTDIMMAALLPAILYFCAVWVGINAYTKRYALKALPKEQLPSRRVTWITAGFFGLPFLVLIERLFVAGFTPQYAACVAILVAVFLLFINVELTVHWPTARTRLQNACINAGKQIATIASIILCASLIIGVLGATGLGVKITSLILSLSGQVLWPAVLLTALACLILGMEVPTTAAYVICISVAGPALEQLGLAPLQAHLFVFWFALLSTITPPVCGAVFIASGMVGENWLKVSAHAMLLGLGLYIIPLAMVAEPALLDLKTQPLEALWIFITLLIALMALSYSLIAPMRVWTRLGLLLLAGSMVLLW